MVNFLTRILLFLVVNKETKAMSPMYSSKITVAVGVAMFAWVCALNLGMLGEMGSRMRATFAMHQTEGGHSVCNPRAQL